MRKNIYIKDIFNDLTLRVSLYLLLHALHSSHQPLILAASLQLTKLVCGKPICLSEVTSGKVEAMLWQQ